MRTPASGVSSPRDCMMTKVAKVRIRCVGTDSARSSYHEYQSVAGLHTSPVPSARITLPHPRLLRQQRSILRRRSATACGAQKQRAADRAHRRRHQSRCGNDPSGMPFMRPALKSRCFFVINRAEKTAIDGIALIFLAGHRCMLLPYRNLSSAPVQPLYSSHVPPSRELTLSTAT